MRIKELPLTPSLEKRGEKLPLTPSHSASSGHALEKRGERAKADAIFFILSSFLNLFEFW
jgi:hypothetical protein